MDDDQSPRNGANSGTRSWHQVLPRLAAAGIAAALAIGGTAVATTEQPSPDDALAKLIKIEETGASLPEAM
jgi:hypothetical protein